jgi:hypothetical protein
LLLYPGKIRDLQLTIRRLTVARSPRSTHPRRDSGSSQRGIDRDATAARRAREPAAPIAEDGGQLDVPARGRPKMGVVAREVTLLPHQWDWLNAQPGGASATLRHLVETSCAAAPGAAAPGAAALAQAPESADSQPVATAVAVPPAPGAPAPPSRAALPLPVAAVARPRSPLDDLLPFDLREAARRLIQSAFGVVSIEAAARLPVRSRGGARLIRLTVKATDYLLHVGEAPARADPVREAACRRIAAAVGIAPGVVPGGEGERIVIMNSLDVTGSDAPIGWTGLERLVETVKLLHGAALFPAWMHYLDYVAVLIEEVGAAGILPPTVLASSLGPFRELLARYPRHERDRVSSHNDLNTGSVWFARKRPWLVGWESAFATDLYADVAAIANWFGGGGEDVEEIVLRAYFGTASNSRHRARLYLMQQANRLFNAMAMLRSAAAARPGLRLSAAELAAAPLATADLQRAWAGVTGAAPDGELRFACVLLRAIRHHFEDRRFGESLVIVSARAPD